MKTKIFVILLAVIFTSITLKSDTQVPVVSDTPLRFKVCVYVRPDDTELDSRLEAFLRRELRALGDVELVKRDSDWHYFLAYDLLEIKRKDGTKTGHVSIASVDMGWHPDVIHKTYRFPELGKPALFRDIGAAYWPADDLHAYAIEHIGSFDKHVLERFRSK